MPKPNHAADVARLLATDDRIERNDLAVRLAEERAPGVVRAIGRLLENPDTWGVRGTLLYALSLVPVADLDRDTVRAVMKVAEDPSETGEARSEADMILGAVESSRARDAAP